MTISSLHPAYDRPTQSAGLPYDQSSPKPTVDRISDKIQTLLQQTTGNLHAPTKAPMSGTYLLQC